ncbi:MAG: ABC transporter substrate-binding protein [Vicinamibacteria bacterium]|nr:ABC transporter substrate-binding protein [Vicinamibacteria bacterium]
MSCHFAKPEVQVLGAAHQAGALIARQVVWLCAALGWLGAAIPPVAHAGPPPPRRVASLNLTADEILAEILPLDRLVAVTAAADDPSMSHVVGRYPASIPRFLRADLERLIALSPDLVIVSEYTDADFLRMLATSGMAVHRMQGLRSLAGIRAAILQLGARVGVADAAQRLAQRFDEQIRETARRIAQVKRPRVLYWSTPFSVGGDTSIDALIECGGGTNVGRELGLVGLAPLGVERAFVSNPDILLVASEDDARALANQPLLARLPAVRDRRVVVIPTRHLVTLSQHAASSCTVIAAALHPQR